MTHQTIAPGIDPDYDEYAEQDNGTDRTPHVPDVVDVRVLNELHVTENPARTIITDQIVLPTDGTRVRIVNRLRSRTRVTIKGSTAVGYIGDRNVTVTTGYQIGTSHTIVNSTDEIWACASGACTLYVISEIREG